MSPVWEQVAWILHDDYLAFADAAVDLAEHERVIEVAEVDPRTGVIDGTTVGGLVVAAMTQADDPVPVEVLRDDKGEVTAVRVCWTNDVDELDAAGEGAWQAVAELPLSSGRCLVWDPRHAKAEDRREVAVVKGTYTCEAFLTGSDTLGLRVRKVDVETIDTPTGRVKIRRGLGLTREQIQAQIARQPKAMKKLKDS